MIWLYRLLFLPALCLALPYYGIRMWRRGGYGESFGQRFGAFPQLGPPADGKRRIWLQAVSVGEVLAVGPMIDALQRSGTVDIVLTTTTSTGYREARRRYADLVTKVGLFPLDFWLCNRWAWNRIQPDAVVLTESELWPEHLHRARRLHRAVFLVNARISERSFRRYQSWPRFARRLLGHFDRIFAASHLDAERLKTLGARPERITCTGSIKFDVAVPAAAEAEEKAAMRKNLGFAETASGTAPFVLLGASTWPGEEAALLRAQAAARAAGVDCRLLIVPRHAERATEIIALLREQHLTWHQRSSKAPAPADVSIYLADTTGELAQLTALADLAFIGKSLPPNAGGQTPIEAAGLGIAMLMGPGMDNFKELAQRLNAQGAAITVADADELRDTVIQLAQSPDKRSTMRAAAREWHKANRGSSERIADAILDCLRSG